jgi:hypothetical protein
MQPLDLINVQIRLEYVLDTEGLVPFPDSSEQALYIVYRHAGGTLSFFNQKLLRKVCLFEE